MVVTSTSQEIQQQYELYDHYQPDRMEVIPPGVDLSLFSPPDASFSRPPIADQINRFLHDGDKPAIRTSERILKSWWRFTAKAAGCRKLRI
jgi:sucrose-phosphate synthase